MKEKTLISNQELLSDRYEFEMSQTYFKEGIHEKLVVFDMFYRTVPDGGSFAIASGLEMLLDYIKTFEFTQEHLEFLIKQGFEKDFVDYLKNFKFTGKIRAIEEGTVVYPNEPIIQIIAPLIEAQMIETYLLTVINYSTLISTKARRISYAAHPAPVMEFGARRAHSPGATVLGGRAAYIGGVSSTSNVLVDYEYGVPSVGTMAHSFVTLYENEYDSFKSFAINNPDNCVLLIDTYDTLKSGLVNAIRIHKEVLVPMGKKLKGVRLDSGDLAYLSLKVREAFDAEGMDALVYASNSLDEFTIQSMKLQDSKIDVYGVGERLITSKSSPTFGGVYKLVAVDDKDNGVFVPRIKVSEDTVKVITPAYKDLYRVYDKNGHSVYDIMSLNGENPENITEFIDSDLSKPKKVRAIEDGFVVKSLLVDVVVDGKVVYDSPSLEEIKAHVQNQLENEVWPTELRLQNPSVHYVNHSVELYELKMDLIIKNQK